MPPTASPVRRILRVRSRARYEAAFVFPLPRQVARYVRGLRGRLPVSSGTERQLEPHLTVLFLGRWPGHALSRWRRALQALRGARARVALRAVGCFRQGARVTNIHLRLSGEDELRSVHRRALEACTAAGWRPSTRYVGRGYVPHITILDRISAGADIMRDPALRDIPGGPFLLGRPRLIGLVLSPP